MAEWVRLCAVNEVPAEGGVTEMEANGTAICLARIGGRVHALDNACPHRQGPLGEGWVEGNAVVCPWHAWAFNVTSGQAAEPEKAQVRVYALQEQGDELLVDLA